MGGLFGEGVPDGVVVGEVHGEVVDPVVPGSVGPGDFADPLEEIEGPVVVGLGLGDKTVGVIAPPLLPLLLEPVDDKFLGLVGALHRYSIVNYIKLMRVAICETLYACRRLGDREGWGFK